MNSPDGMLSIGLLFSLIGAQLFAGRARHLFRSNFWMDEIVTFRLVTSVSLGHSIRAIIAGLDTNPPLHHLILSILRKWLLRYPEYRFRFISLIAVLAGIFGVYQIVRDISTPLTGAAVAFAIWNHPAIPENAFSARMYGFWFTATIWFSVFLGHSTPAIPSTALLLATAITAILVSNLHTLGPVVFGLVVTAHLIAGFNEFKTWTAISAIAAGPLASLIWSPVVWRQNRAYPVSWIAERRGRYIREFLNYTLLRKYVVFTIVTAGLILLLQPHVPLEHSIVSCTSSAALKGLSGLLLMPAVLILISITIAPVWMGRYGFPTVAGLVPVFAFLIIPMTPTAALAFMGIIFLAGWLRLSSLADDHQTCDSRHRTLIETLSGLPVTSPILFESPLDLYVVTHYAPSLAPRCGGLDFESSELEDIDPLYQAHRDHIRIAHRYFSVPGMFRWNFLKTLPAFFLVADPEANRSGTRTMGMNYPGFQKIVMGDGLYHLIQWES